MPPQTLVLGELFVVAVAVSLIIVAPAAMICRKLGYPAWFGIAAAIPGVNIVFLWFLALSQWPNDRGGASGR